MEDAGVESSATKLKCIKMRVESAWCSVAGCGPIAMPVVVHWVKKLRVGFCAGHCPACAEGR